MITNQLTLPAFLATSMTLFASGAAIALLPAVPSVAPPLSTTAELLPAGIHVMRDRPIVALTEFNSDLEVAQVAADVEDYCQSMSGGVPDPADLVTYLEALYENVWLTTTPAWQYFHFIDEQGDLVTRCILVHKIYVLDEGSTEPVLVLFRPSMEM